MSLLAGSRLGRYEIVGPLGKGGMGEVYLAEDTLLERKVALKILPAEVGSDEQRMQRFTQEAKTASALNHPNILTIHEIGHVDSTHFIATEFIQGVTLRRRIAEGRMSLDEVLNIAMQTASALAAAHDAGVVHRDIKPENIMLRTDGFVKVLDFGLAKLAEKEKPLVGNSEAPTLARPNTAPGIVMGTVNYMSPEQASGIKDIDERTDIWSLGVVIYEMVAHRLPFGFAGATPTQIISLIIQKEAPSLKQYASEVPDELNRMVMKALENKREERYQSVKEMLVDLRRLSKQLEREAGQKRSISPEPSGSMATSSAEYVVSEISRHKLAALAALMVVAGLAIGVWYYVHSQNSKVTIDSIAVLPFTNTSNDPDTEYLSDGMTESLINSLSQLSNLNVKARSSVFHYKGKEIALQKVGQELNVQAVLLGRIVQRGDSFMVSWELVDTKTENHLAGEQYDRKLTNLVQLQSEIARDVSTKLRPRLSGADGQRVAKNYTENNEAYQLYLKGRYFWNKRTNEDFKKAIPYFQQAIERDPNYALAYSGLSDSYDELWAYDGARAHEAMPKAKAAALKALLLDDDLAEAHASLGMYLMDYEYDRAGAERELKRAIELNPNYASVHQFYAELLYNMGRFEEALAEARRAVELDPLSRVINTMPGRVLFFARRYDEAIAQFKKNIDFDPNWGQDHYYLYETYAAKGMYAEAVAEYGVAQTLGGESPSEIQATQESFAKSGWKGFLQHRLEYREGQSKREHVAAYTFAYLYSRLGDRDKAFAWLEKAYQEREYGMSDLNAPWFDNLRSDPRFQDLLRRVGLQQ